MKKSKDPRYDAIKAVIVKATIEFAKQFETKGEKKELKPDARIEGIQEILKRDNFGCKAGAVAELVSLIVGYEFKHSMREASIRIVYPMLSCVVLLGRSNGHGYNFNEPIVVNTMCNDEDGYRGIDATGKQGNYLPQYHKKEMRPAKPEEIDKFLKQIGIDKFIKCSGIVIL